MMGMFDDITVEYAIPDADMIGRVFQTKDLDCMMDHYILTTEGRLLRSVTAWVSDPEEMFGGRLVYTGKTEDTNYHGWFLMYAERERGNWEGEWVEYMVKFTDGQLVAVDTNKREQAT